jgi:hypothetical protein
MMISGSTSDENTIVGYARIESVRLLLALPALLLIVVLLWLESLRIAPHWRIRQENSHISAHFRLGAKRLGAPDSSTACIIARGSTN